MPKKLVSDKQAEAVAKEYAKLQKVDGVSALFIQGHFKRGWDAAEAYYFRVHPAREKRAKSKEVLG